MKQGCKRVILQGLSPDIAMYQLMKRQPRAPAFGLKLRPGKKLAHVTQAEIRDRIYLSRQPERLCQLSLVEIAHPAHAGSKSSRPT
jgi:hypothetical protein